MLHSLVSCIYFGMSFQRDCLELITFTKLYTFSFQWPWPIKDTGAKKKNSSFLALNESSEHLLFCETTQESASLLFTPLCHLILSNVKCLF